MFFSAKRFHPAAAAGVVVLGGLSLAFGAQQPPQPQPPAQKMTSTPVAGFQSVPVATPAYAPGFYSPFYDPLGGFMSGSADIVNSQGQYLVQRQQANLTREQVQSAKIDNRRKALDEWLYERAVTPTPEEERERARMQNVMRSRNDPPITEIWSGKALNDLLQVIQQKQGRGQGPPVALAPDVVSRLNVTSGATPGSVGLLREGGRLTWPLALTAPDFDTERKKVDQFAAQAFKQASEYGAVPPDAIRGMAAGVDSMLEQLRAHVGDLTPSDYIKAKRYLNELEGTIKTLQDPNVAKYFSGKWVPKGNSVGELVAQMTSQGLRFAPAVGGDEAAYVATHRAMVTYDDGLTQTAGR
jgi:hypothetical protein